MSKDRLLEQHTIDYIPIAERRGKVWHLWPIWFAGDAHLATLAVGVIGLALGANLAWTTIAVVGGCAFGTLGGETLDPSRPPARKRLELESTDVAAEVDRLVALGATRRAERDDHVVLADPDGNELWLRRAAP